VTTLYIYIPRDIQNYIAPKIVRTNLRRNVSNQITLINFRLSKCKQNKYVIDAFLQKLQGSWSLTTQRQILRPTHKHTHRPHYSVCSNRSHDSHLCLLCMRCSLDNYFFGDYSKICRVHHVTGFERANQVANNSDQLCVYGTSSRKYYSFPLSACWHNQ